MPRSTRQLRDIHRNKSCTVSAMASSSVYSHFYEPKNAESLGNFLYECKHCKKSISSCTTATSNLRRHLKVIIYHTVNFFDFVSHFSFTIDHCTHTEKNVNHGYLKNMSHIHLYFGQDMSLGNATSRCIHI